MSVILETSLGDITIDLYTDERPRCCINFVKLCKMKYYNWSLFHSVQQNLVAQAGDPTCTGRGGESVFAKVYGEQAKFFEMEVKPRIKHKKSGLISMVNNGSNMHGSQFFITCGEDLDYLDGVHTVFGEVAEGFDTLEKLNETICDDNNRPYQDIRIFHTVVLDDPYEDPAGLDIPAHSPQPTKEQLEGQGYIGVDEEIDDAAGKTEQEVDEMMKEKEAKANAQVLEMIGDLPAADAPPPENVLFVCKLNPVTTEEDLEIIFSRFGDIVSCEVIKDRKTEESLQYAFIEFKDSKSCENAYFKMDNVLIDDRRIHVDFSQSVAKLKWKGKGRGVEHIGDQKDEEKTGPKYVVKNKSRRGQEYDLVMSDEDTETKQKKKKKKRSQSRDREDRPRQRDGSRDGYSRNNDKYRQSSNDYRRERVNKSPKRRSRSRDRSPKRRSRSPKTVRRERSPRQRSDSSEDERSHKRKKQGKSKHRERDGSPKYRERSRSPKRAVWNYSPKRKNRDYSPKRNERDYSPKRKDRDYSPKRKDRDYSPKYSDRDYSPKRHKRESSPKRYKSRR